MGVIIPRTPLPEPTFRCGHPKDAANSVQGTGLMRDGVMCRFCTRVRQMNATALVSERRRNSRLDQVERWFK